jgi:Family of unknown function (DUF6328)
VDRENEEERVNRELIELLNEIRVALPGVQVLFAFLLVLPFQQGFARASDQDKAVYTVAILASAIGAALLIAPSIYHRLTFRHGPATKERMLFDSSRLLIGGLLTTAVGVACAIYLAMDVVYGGVPALGATIGVAAVLVGAWLVLPLARRRAPR